MMGRWIRRLVVWFVLLTAASAIAARVAKGRIETHGTADSDEVALAGIGEPVVLESHSKQFRGGTVTAWFGGVDLDLRQATLDPAGARVTWRALFGGGRLIVPAEWRVSLQVLGILGGVADVRPQVERDPDAPLLIVDGIAVLGGLGIVSDKTEEEVRHRADEVARKAEEIAQETAVPAKVNGGELLTSAPTPAADQQS